MLDNFYVFKTIVYTFLSSHGIGGISDPKVATDLHSSHSSLGKASNSPSWESFSKPITLSEREDRQVKLLQNYENNLPPQSWRL